MQKIKQLLSFILKKETLTKIILLQLIVLLFIIINGNLEIDIDSIDGSLSIYS